MFFHSGTKKTYIFQWFSMFFHKTKTETIHIPMVSQVFSIKINENHTYSNGFPCFWSPGKSWWDLAAAFAYLLAKTSQDLKNLENHWNMYGFHCFRMKKHRKPLEYVWFSFLFYEKLGKSLEYVWFSLFSHEKT